MLFQIRYSTVVQYSRKVIVLYVCCVYNVDLIKNTNDQDKNVHKPGLYDTTDITICSVQYSTVQCSPVSQYSSKQYIVNVRSRLATRSCGSFVSSVIDQFFTIFYVACLLAAGSTLSYYLSY
jgi:hypothetical protein